MRKLVWKLALFYLLIVNLLGFALMGWDKGKAKKDQWRVPESRLFLVAIIGGSVGCWLGMQHFRHKTKHPLFVIGIPLIFVLQIALLVFIWSRLFWNAGA